MELSQTEISINPEYQRTLIKKPKRKSIIYYFRLFCQRTSIRGIPKVETSKQLCLKCYWVFFVVISFAVLGTLYFLLILRFLKYDTIIKNTYVTASLEDYPEITICSKRFYDLGTSELKSPFTYVDEYSSKLYNNVLEVINKGDVKTALLILKYQNVVSAFFHDQYDFIRNRTFHLVKHLNKNCLITKDVNENFDINNKTYCSVRAIFNPQFLNCLGFKVPRNYVSNSTRFIMNINIKFAEIPNNFHIEKFNMDEYLLDTEAFYSYQDSRLYIHNPLEYPFNPKYEFKLNCFNNNYYIVDKIVSSAYQYNTKSGINCRKHDLILSSYNVSFKVLNRPLCRSLIKQEHILKRCNCFMPNEATNSNLYTYRKLCIEDTTLLSCANEVINELRDYVNIVCLKNCTIAYYNVLIKQSPIYASSFSQNIETSFADLDECLKKNDDTHICCDEFNDILKKEFVYHFNRTCRENIKTNITKTINSSTDKNKNCNELSIKIQMKTEKNLKVETLVVQINDLLSQLAGMSSFITGFTFTFIAEVMEVFIIWILEYIR